MNASSHVTHDIEPVFDARSRVLLLGTMPSPASREAGFFYGHPHNRFWRMLAAIFDEPMPETVDDKRDLLLRRRIALWDVLASCDIEGASDASIRNARANDLRRILDAADIRAVFATGTKAAHLYRNLCEPALGVSCEALPSTSPANAKMRLDDLTHAYADALAPYLADERESTAPVLDVECVVELERRIAASGTPLSALMRRAGRALAKYAVDAYRNLHGDSDEKPRVAVLCGAGNNGGDGWVAAEEFARQGYAVCVISPCKADEVPAQPARTAAMAANETLSAHETCRMLANPDVSEVEGALAQTDIIIDALLGTGFSGREVRAPFDAWIRLANARHEAGVLVVAADTPSGLDAQTGRAATPCIKADLTVTMMALKPGLATPYAFAFCGDVRVAPIAYLEPHLEAMGISDEKHPAAPPRAGERRDEFLRPESEDDDGYDPYSDRRAAPEPLFQENPWD